MIQCNVRYLHTYCSSQVSTSASCYMYAVTAVPSIDALSLQAGSLGKSLSPVDLVVKGPRYIDKKTQVFKLTVFAHCQHHRIVSLVLSTSPFLLTVGLSQILPTLKLAAYHNPFCPRPVHLTYSI